MIIIRFLIFLCIISFELCTRTNPKTWFKADPISQMFLKVWGWLIPGRSVIYLNLKKKLPHRRRNDLPLRRAPPSTSPPHPAPRPCTSAAKAGQADLYGQKDPGIAVFDFSRQHDRSGGKASPLVPAELASLLYSPIWRLPFWAM